MKRSLTLIAALLLMGTASAQNALASRSIAAIPSDSASEQKSQLFRNARLAKGTELKRRVRRVVKELDWHKSLDAAVTESRKIGKPIFWLQMLGDLDGPT